jgi:hypothetical protein
MSDKPQTDTDTDTTTTTTTTNNVPGDMDQPIAFSPVSSVTPPPNPPTQTPPKT